MFKRAGQIHALHVCGLTKEAKILDRNILRTLIGEPERLLHPIQMLKEIGSLKPTRAHLQTMLHGQSALEKAKGFGRLAGDISAKGFTFGFPAYGVYKGVTEQPQPGETRGKVIGRALGEGLGWLPPAGILGTAAAMFTPEYSLPGLTGRLGGALGKRISGLIKREQPLTTRDSV